MSTRARIARPTSPDDPTRYEGVYLHSDGYPTFTGRAIWQQVVNEFNRDAEAAARYYIDAHPTGWCGLMPDATTAANECFCHDRGEGEQGGWISDQTHDAEFDWTYVLRPEGLEIRRWDRGVVALVRWDADRLNFSEIEAKGHAL